MAQSVVPMVFQGNGEVKFHEIQGEFCLAAEDIGRGLGYEFPEESVNKIVQRYIDEIKPYRLKVNLTFYYTEEAIYLISMLARTEKAKEFRQKVAILLKELRQQKIVIASRKAVSGYRSLLKRMEKKGRGNKFIHNLVRYRKMGLHTVEVARLLSVSKDTVHRYEKIIKLSGLWEAL